MDGPRTLDDDWRSAPRLGTTIGRPMPLTDPAGFERALGTRQDPTLQDAPRPLISPLRTVLARDRPPTERPPNVTPAVQRKTSGQPLNTARRGANLPLAGPPPRHAQPPREPTRDPPRQILQRTVPVPSSAPAPMREPEPPPPAPDPVRNPRPKELDDLARHLTDPLDRLLRAEATLLRERSGGLTP